MKKHENESKEGVKATCYSGRTAWLLDRKPNKTDCQKESVGFF